MFLFYKHVNPTNFRSCNSNKIIVIILQYLNVCLLIITIPHSNSSVSLLLQHWLFLSWILLINFKRGDLFSLYQNPKSGKDKNLEKNVPITWSSISSSWEILTFLKNIGENLAHVFILIWCDRSEETRYKSLTHTSLLRPNRLLPSTKVSY